MRVLASAALVLLLSAGSAFAQRGGSRGGPAGGGFRGGFTGARIHAPAGGFHRGVAKPGFRIGFGSSFARNRLFFGHQNRFFFHKGFGKGFGFSRGFGFGAGYYVPYSYVLPAYPDYYYSPYSLGYAGLSPYSLGYPAAAAPPPAYTPPASPVVITQQFTSPVIRESSPLVYEPPARQPPAQAPEDRSAAIYLIAMKGNVIRPALAYWVDNGILHYVGLDRKQAQVPLSEVDRDLSRQLNRERGVPFRLPDAP